MSDSDEKKLAADDGDRAKIRVLPWALLSGKLNSFFALWTFGGSVFVLFLNALYLVEGAGS